MSEVELLLQTVKSFRLLELQNLMLFAGKSKLGKKSELLVRAEELIKDQTDKKSAENIARKIKELRGEMYKPKSDDEETDSGQTTAAAPPSTKPAETGPDASKTTTNKKKTSILGVTNSEKTTGDEDEAPLAVSKKKKSSKKKSKEKKKKKDKKKKKSPSKKSKSTSLDRYDPKPKGKSKQSTAPPPPPAAAPVGGGRSRRAAAIAATSALQSWARDGQTGDGDSEAESGSDEEPSDESSSEDESSGTSSEAESEADGDIEEQETRPKKKGGKNQAGKNQTAAGNKSASATTAAAANNGLSALSAMVPQAAQGSILGGTLPPPGQPLDPSRLAAAYSHLMGRGSISTLGSAGAPATTGAGPTAATPTPPARRNYCGFTYRTVPREIPAKSPTTPSSSNYLQCAERPANSGYVNNSSVNSYTNKSTHLIYPTCPDVRLKRLPFYDVMATLLKPSSLQPTGSARFQEQTFSFHLTPQQVSAIEQSGYRDSMGRPDYKKQIQVRFSLLETSCEQADNFPSSVCVKVNGRLQPLPNPIPTNKPGVEPKRPPKAINVTGLCKLSSTVANYINVSWTVEVGKGFTLSVYFVEKLNAPELLEKLKKKGQRNADYTRAVIKEKLGDTDNEIATTSCKVSLACPLGKMRMRLPVRSSQCDHLQCFDAANYIMMNEKKDKWMCPVCNNIAPFDTLMLDGYFSEILESRRLPTDDHEIVLHADASWDPLPPKIPDHLNPKLLEAAGAPMPGVKKEEKVETLSLDDEGPSGTAAAPSTNKKSGEVDCVTLDSSDDEEDEAEQRATAAAIAAVAAAEKKAAEAAAAKAEKAAAEKRAAAAMLDTLSQDDDTDEIRPPSKRRKTSRPARVIFDDEDDDDQEEEQDSDQLVNTPPAQQCGPVGKESTSGTSVGSLSSGATPTDASTVTAAHQQLLALAAAAAAGEDKGEHSELTKKLSEMSSRVAAAAAAAAEPELVCLDDSDD